MLAIWLLSVVVLSNGRKYYDIREIFKGQHDDSKIDLTTNALAMEEIQGLLYSLKTTSFWIELHFRKHFPNQTSVFENQGHIYDVMQQTIFYSAVSRSRPMNTICETGFNAGHSAIVWLYSNPNATYV
jgi:hypothetical protein